MKTSVLFICHQINEESIFRYGRLKTACDKMGYDLFWMVDSLCKHDNFPKNIQFHQHSLERFYEKSNLNPYVVNHRPNITRKNNTAITSTQLFRMDTNDLYDRIWHIEYDVFYVGDWVKFFEKYENVDSDLITAWNYERPEYNFDWYHCKFMNQEQFECAKKDPYFSITLNCCCRMSKRLLIDIYEYLLKLGEPSFQEWVIPTVANTKGYQTLFFSSNCFRPNKIKGFSDYRSDVIYHPLKLNVSSDKILKLGHGGGQH